VTAAGALVRRFFFALSLILRGSFQTFCDTLQDRIFLSASLDEILLNAGELFWATAHSLHEQKAKWF
jgi:hypothetical protein